jgi:hypothetical protein
MLTFGVMGTGDGIGGVYEGALGIGIAGPLCIGVPCVIGMSLAQQPSPKLGAKLGIIGIPMPGMPQPPPNEGQQPSHAILPQHIGVNAL